MLGSYFLAQPFASIGLLSKTLPLWALNRTEARDLLLQRLRELTSRPFLPPCIRRMNLETGASGTDSKVVRMPPLTESMRPTRATLICPRRSATRSGRGLEDERR